MGIDVYMYAECRAGGGWTLCEPLTAERYVSLPGELPDGYLAPAPLYAVRNYPLFAILAGITNRTNSVSPYDVLGPRRGLPSDLSPELRDWSARFGVIDAPSWFLLGELERFPWRDRRIRKQAMVDVSVAGRFGDGNGPRPTG